MGLNLGKKIEKLIGGDEPLLSDVETFYTSSVDESLEENNGKSKMLLKEPKAYSEAAEIVDQLKKRTTVVVNLKRVTNDQAKRIIDFLYGSIYAIEGKIEKIGGGIFLCTPKNVDVEGNITDDSEGKGIHNNSDLNLEW